jgi:hypothetical protein
LPKPALAGQAGHGYSDGNEEPYRREGIDSERDGKVEGGVSALAGGLAREIAMALLIPLDFLDELLDRYRSLLQNAMYPPPTRYEVELRSPLDRRHRFA